MTGRQSDRARAASADVQPACSLEGEIALLRALVRRLIDCAEEDYDLAQLLKLVDVASRCAARLGTLVAQQQRLDAARETGGGLSAEITARIAEFAARYPASGFDRYPASGFGRYPAAQGEEPRP